ncbi:MAG: tetratricopeptide repeat protein [Spirochaetaceae bacterium]|jgi:tetratricopeptide (TPR) repeat protein|nr:tetratricopeptide repeat protein [Spirochaetaceae bacterium]
MMKFDPILTRAFRLARRGKFGEAIHNLENEAVRYQNSFIYYYVLGVLCLHAGDFGGALTYLKRAREVKFQDPQVLLGLAVLFLRRGDTDRALDLYLEVLDKDGHNRIAQKALNGIRKYSGTDAFPLWIESGKLVRFYPPLPKLPPRIAVAALGILIVVMVCGGILLKFNIISLPVKSVFPRDGYAGSALEHEELQTPVQIGGSYRYILTKDQVVDTYNRARSLFTDLRDEAARVELNRIIESNASEAIKNKARLLLSYLEVPGFDSLKDRFPYPTVAEDPGLYRDCYVIWRGMATNLDAGESVTAFDFLVGYDTRRTLEGIVPVVFNFSVAVNPEKPLEVLGRVIPVVTGDGQGAAVHLEGIALYQPGILDNRR